ncbi:YgjV family protein [bacterium]|nr:YgjV family protein [bacterium]
MNETYIVGAIGYVGSALVLISMLMTSAVRLRAINTTGSLIFTGYALAIQSYPTAAMNFSLALINIYNLAKLLKNKKEYSIVTLQPDDAFITYFLNLYKADIEKFFPEFVRTEECDCVYLVCRGTEAAGILLGTKSGASIDVKIDYATPVYRDCSVGKYLYSYLASQQISELFTENVSENHKSYLKKMGFLQEDKRFVKKL